MVAAVAAGNALATVSANGYLQSSHTLAIAFAAWAGLIDVAEMPVAFREFFTPSVLITGDNVQQFMADSPVFDFAHPFRGAWDSAMN
jgi:ABC-type sugar transport system substrate-binding protein